MPLARYAVAAVLGLVVLVALMLVVRPLIFSFAPERGDGNYAVAAAAEIGSTPVERTLLLNESHGLPGEQPNGRRVTLRILVSQSVAGGVAALDGWNAQAGCEVEVSGDRLRDCDGSTWTYQGVPIQAPGPLQRFPAQVQSGAVIVDFTRPLPAS